MPVNSVVYKQLSLDLKAKGVTLVAVSKTKPMQDIQALYDAGQRDFGENYVQEVVDKEQSLPKDIRWHFIGHLQTNKVKNIAPFVHLVHGIDSLRLLKELNKQAINNSRIIECLLQVHIAEEETKFGFNENELDSLLTVSVSELAALKNIKIRGLMGMASFSADAAKIQNEFKKLKTLFDKYDTVKAVNCHFTILSMGMSSDYNTAITAGSNLVRIGSLLFGERNKV